MVEKFCNFLLKQIRKQMPEIDDERAEVILYGIELIVGEIPKFFILLAVSIVLGIWWQTLLAFFLILPYRIVSGGFHLKTHLGCIICTNLMYCGNAYLSNVFNFPNNISKYITLIAIFIFGVIMVGLYAPADTENVPILTKKERKTKKVLSFVFLTINAMCGLVVPNTIVSNIFIFGTLFQTLSITRLAYKITNNNYGYEEYLKQEQHVTI